MQVKCIANLGKNLSPKTIQSGQLVTTEYNLDIGQEYTVYGILVWGGSLRYLIVVLDDLPGWYPAELLEVVDHLLPLEWYYNFRGYEDNSLYAIWGYKEMVFDTDKHYDALIEREPEALEIFFKRKKEIDEYEALNKYREKKT